MPRVTPEHSEARRTQIINAARACFVREGFHQTSMQDIQRESGLSAGAIYLYFKSKREIVLAIVQDILGVVGETIPQTPVFDGTLVDVATIVRRFLELAEALDRERTIFPMALMVWSEATRDPSILSALRVSIDRLIDQVTTFIIGCQTRGLLDPDTEARNMALAFLGLGHGFIIQRTLLDPDVRERYSAGVEALLRYRPSDEGDVVGQATG